MAVRIQLFTMVLHIASAVKHQQSSTNALASSFQSVMHQIPLLAPQHPTIFAPQHQKLIHLFNLQMGMYQFIQFTNINNGR